MCSNILLLTHWFFIFPGSSTPKTCKLIGSYSIICYYTGWFSLLFLCCEIRIIFRRKLYKSAKLRIFIYIVSSIIFSIIILLCYHITGSVGISSYETCFIAKSSIGEKVDMALLFFIYLSILFTYLLIRKQIDCYASRTFRQFSEVLILVLFCGTISRILEFFIILRNLTNSQTTDTEVVIGSVFGLLTSSVVPAGRLIHPKVRKEIYALFSRNRKKTGVLLEGIKIIEEDTMKSILGSPKEVTIDDISDTFEKLGHRLLVQILVVLTLKFKNLPEPASLEKSSTSKNERIEIKFDKSFFSNLALEFNMPFIQNYFCPKFSIIEFEPRTFAAIRESQDLSNNDLLESLLCFENIRRLASINNSGGKSESLFFSSIDGKIVIKTITGCERESFLSFLPEYSKRIIECPESRLVRILGLFQVYPNTQDFIIMENVLGRPENSVIFDLKGSTVDRKIKGIDKKNPPYGVVLKDINFLKFNQKVVIKDSKRVIHAIFEDCKVLRNAGLMDYSLLVGFHKQSFENRYTKQGKYSIAIIDFFQKYGIRKSAEGCWKRCFSRKNNNISSISPKKYFFRFKEFLSSVIVEQLTEKNELT